MNKSIIEFIINFTHLILLGAFLSISYLIGHKKGYKKCREDIINLIHRAPKDE